MLSTPGRSPRLLPLPSPSPSPSQKQRNGKAIMGPPSSKAKKRRPRDVEVLDEDAYVEAIEHIVQRDYFPDLPRLQDRLEWLEAIRTGDPEVIRAAQVRIVTRRAQRSQRSSTPSSSVRGTPASARRTPASVFGTPGGVSLAASTRTPGGSSVMGDGEEEDAEEAALKQERLKMSLDEFLLSHTSQDNASFQALKEKDNRKTREKAAQLYLTDNPKVEDDKSSAGSSKALIPAGESKEGGGALVLTSTKKDPDRDTDGFGSTGQPTSSLNYWPYTAKNTLMYDSSNRDAAPLTQAEITERAMGPPKEVKHRNTRFRSADTQQQQQAFKLSVEDKVAILYNPIPGETPVRYLDPRGDRGSMKTYDLEELRRTPKNAFERALDEAGLGDQPAKVQSVGLDGKPTSYEYVSTPVFNPGEGVDASPLMTWGDIESTPLRLEAEDTPVGIGGAADGPHFTIPKAAPRDEAAINMSRAAAKNLKQRERSKAGMDSPGLGIGMSPANRRKGGLTPGMSPGIGLSPAARKLVSKAAKMKGSSGFDATLRASYANSPLRMPQHLSSAKKQRTSGLEGPSPSPLV